MAKSSHSDQTGEVTFPKENFIQLTKLKLGRNTFEQFLPESSVG